MANAPSILRELGAILVVSVSLAGQIAAQPKLAGRITDDTGEERIANARVALSGGSLADPILNRTDSQGGFEFSVAPGRYRIAVEKAGYFPLTPVDIEATIGALPIVLTRKRSLTGTLRFPDGEPVIGALVTAYLVTPRIGTAAPLAHVDTTATDERGTFQFDQLRGGRYIVAVQPSREPGVRPRNLRYVPAATPDPGGQAIDLRFRPEHDLGVIVIDEGGGVEIDGMVTASKTLAAGTPVTVFLSIGTELPAYAASIVTRTGSPFHFDRVPPGSYDISAISTWPLEVTFGLQSIHVDSGPVRGLVLEAPEALVTVSGTVYVSTDGESRPVPSVRVRASFDAGPSRSMPAWRSTGADGDFKLFLSPATGAGTVEAIHISVEQIPRDTYVAELVQGERHQSAEPFYAVAGSGPVQFVLKRDGATVDGEVSPKPIPGQSRFIVLAPDDRNAAHAYRSVPTDAKGRFRLQGIAPGAYTLYTFGSEMDYLGEESLKSSIAPPLPVALKAAETRTIRIQQ